MICPTTGRVCEKERLGSRCPYPCLPRVYVLELACEGCDATATVVAPGREHAEFEAHNIGWSLKPPLWLCHRCWSKPQ